MRIGVVGAGFMGTLYARLLPAVPDVELAWIAETDTRRHAELAERFGVPVLTRARWDEVDAVVVATPDDVRDPVLEALQAGRHVLVEKPLATSVAEATRLLAARPSPAHLMVGHLLRFDPRVAQAVAACRGLGALWTVRAWRANSLLAARRIGTRTSVAWFLGIHDVDLVHHVTGRRISRVRARGLRVVSPHDDHVEVHAWLTDGTPVELRWSWLLPVERASGLSAGLELVGAEGMCEVELSHTDVALTSRGGRTEQLDTYHWPPDAGIPGGDLRQELMAFVTAVRTETRPPVTGEDGLAAVAVVEAVERSIRAGGRETEVKDP
ncbi:UDP-N-acetylglucosamine 3-dehydrogenase [Thermasporomyces composti]|uniref:UDP-N-acetylglucosamine 3-dehydrogenase n=2 Tax=Thermasporomyces composti TaxID=696763 RepID=A0A3D9V4A0_THECX|nr:UDP-N-acetylglucosamine 3-dehydrogenase [Thermasporomyces composti]